MWFTDEGERTIPGVDVWAFMKCVLNKQACAANKDCTGAGSDVWPNGGDGINDGQYCDITKL